MALELKTLLLNLFGENAHEKLVAEVFKTEKA